MTAINKTKFGIYGGQFIPATLMSAIEELTAGDRYREDNFVVEWFEA
jgi:tryptophan synthase beta subunit